MRHSVAKGSVVELARLVGPLDGFGGRANVGPVAGKLVVCEVAGICYMPGTAEGHDGRARLGRPALEVGVGPATGEEADAPLIFARAALGAFGAAVAIPPGVPVLGPGSRHAISIAPPGRYTSASPETNKCGTRAVAWRPAVSVTPVGQPHRAADLGALGGTRTASLLIRRV
jgi:hypothetical protein